MSIWTNIASLNGSEAKTMWTVTEKLQSNVKKSKFLSRQTKNYKQLPHSFSILAYLTTTIICEVKKLEFMIFFVVISGQTCGSKLHIIEGTILTSSMWPYTSVASFHYSYLVSHQPYGRCLLIKHIRLRNPINRPRL